MRNAAKHTPRPAPVAIQRGRHGDRLALARLRVEQRWLVRHASSDDRTEDHIGACSIATPQEARRSSSRVPVASGADTGLDLPHPDEADTQEVTT